MSELIDKVTLEMFISSPRDCLVFSLQFLDQGNEQFSRHGLVPLSPTRSH